MTKPPDLTAEVFLRFFFLRATGSECSPVSREKSTFTNATRRMHGVMVSLLMGSCVTLGKGGEHWAMVLMDTVDGRHADSDAGATV